MANRSMPVQESGNGFGFSHERPHQSGMHNLRVPIGEAMPVQPAEEQQRDASREGGWLGDRKHFQSGFRKTLLNGKTEVAGHLVWIDIQPNLDPVVQTEYPGLAAELFQQDLWPGALRICDGPQQPYSRARSRPVWTRCRELRREEKIDCVGLLEVQLVRCCSRKRPVSELGFPFLWRPAQLKSEDQSWSHGLEHFRPRSDPRHATDAR